MINIATVGTSAITEKFISACKYTGRFNLYAAYSRDKARGDAFAEKNCIGKVYCNLEEMAKDEEIDAVYIASPNVFHFEQSKMFLENGKHVICEKPIVTKSSDYITLSELAKRNNLIYMEAIISRYNESREILKELIKKSGKISQVRLDYCQRSSRYDRFTSGEHINIFDMSLHAGTLMDLGIYCVYAAVDLFGSPESIISTASFLPNKADSSGVSVFKYKDFSAVLTYSKIGNTAIGSEIIGDNGTVKIGSVSQYADISYVSNGSEKMLYGMPERKVVMSGEAAKFADYIEKFEETESDYKETYILALNVHKCMDEIKKSANIKY